MTNAKGCVFAVLAVFAFLDSAGASPRLRRSTPGRDMRRVWNSNSIAGAAQRAPLRTTR